MSVKLYRKSAAISPISVWIVKFLIATSRSYFLVAIIFFTAIPRHSYAKNRNTPFYLFALGCWKKSDGEIIDRLCFDSKGTVTGITSKSGEAFSENGIFQATSTSITIMGFPGNGWPSPNEVDKCKYNVSIDNSKLQFEDCGLNGTWEKTSLK
ncbi:hypothetical protein MKK64_12095 [Methylobacterium sp. E-025]|uniref:hypothetical protein n=1 Tax=Methylobacterium sp. E-025 TaxID=2836561 RepID=UPI001FBBCB58|nr:hypothetical protein [Methylobacterium sp. E-025]MCJ2111936.1 hypothetical protein [Methylobacterium sp. E-025]